MTALSALSSATTAISALSGLVLVSPQKTVGYQPQNPPLTTGYFNAAPLQSSFVFHYEGEQKVHVESDITDHYIEDNTALQDQIALKPVTITTQGFIGELNDVPPLVLSYLQSAADKLTALVAYTPVLTSTAQLAYNEAFFLYQTAQTALQSAVSAVGSLSNAISGSSGQSVINGQVIEVSQNQNLQQAAFQTFFGYWSQRILFTIQTPWAVFENMAILSLEAVQDAETNVISTFNVTFKAINFVSSASSSSAGISAGRLVSQSADPVNLGTSAPTSDIGLSQGLSGQTGFA